VRERKRSLYRFLVTGMRRHEIECHTVTDEFLKQIKGAPQWLIDENQRLLDEYRSRKR
jgi:hypothetical protein